MVEYLFVHGAPAASRGPCARPLGGATRGSPRHFGGAPCHALHALDVFSVEINAGVCPSALPY